MKVVVDAARCRGHGNCAVLAPGVFELGDDERSHVRLPEGADVPAAYQPATDDALASCPEAAISWAP